jgi:hypothetical protein
VTDISTAYSSTGVSGDFVIFVTARKITGSAIAWAAYCNTLASGRPYVAQVNFGPANLSTDPAEFEEQVSTFESWREIKKWKN